MRAPLTEESFRCSHLFIVDEDLLAQAAELLLPSFADSFTRHGCIESVLSELGILLRAPESSNRPLNGKNEVFLLVALKGKAAADLTIPLELDDRVLEPASLECDYWGAPNEELMLHDTTWLEQTRHQTEIGASVHKSAIGEEFFGSRPEAVRVSLFQAPHAVGTLGRVGVIHIARSTD